ncbi:MAG: dihydrolipoyl dehydrogenase [bacterium]|nr:dihydrolipoyl dehydrogenase [bacterium]
MASHDLIVVGGGPAGYAAALYAASAGLDVGLVERSKLGGTCLHVGCIPAKELLETAAVFKAVGRAGEFGVASSTPTLDMAVVQQRKQGIIDRLAGGLAKLLGSRKVTVYDGSGALGADRTVTVTGGGESVTLAGRHIVLATGSVPRSLPGIDVDGERVVTSDELLSVESVPASAVVIGGGAIGCEFASMLCDMGSRLTLLEVLPRLLAGADDEVSKQVERSFKRRGMKVHTGVDVTDVEVAGESMRVRFGDGQEVSADLVVVSVGRRPVTDGLGIDATAVALDERGFVAVDEFCRTGEAGVYAVGDVIATPQLAHVGFAEGILAVQHLLGENPPPIDYANVPWCIYCSPEVAFAGLTEQQAAGAGLDVAVSKHRYAANGRAMIVGETEGFVKVVAERSADGAAGRLLGVHLVGPWATEQLGQGYLAVNWEATVADVAGLIQPHPTLSELFGETVLSLTGRSLHG